MSHLETLIRQSNLTLPEDFIAKAQHYKALLEKWNKIHNLTGAKDEKTMIKYLSKNI